MNQFYPPLSLKNQKRTEPYKFIDPLEVKTGEFVVLQAIEGVTFRGQEIFRVVENLGMREDTVLLMLKCVLHPFSKKHPPERSEDEKEDYDARRYYPAHRKLLVMSPEEVHMLLLNE